MEFIVILPKLIFLSSATHLIPFPSSLPFLPFPPHPPLSPDIALKEHVTSLALKKKVPPKASSRRARKQRRQLSSVPWEASEISMPAQKGQHSRKPSLVSAGGSSFTGLYPAAEHVMDPGTYVPPVQLSVASCRATQSFWRIPVDICLHCFFFSVCCRILSSSLPFPSSLSPPSPYSLPSVPLPPPSTVRTADPSLSTLLPGRPLGLKPDAKRRDDSDTCTDQPIHRVAATIVRHLSTSLL